MSLGFLNSQQGLINTFTWAANATPDGGPIWTNIVTPTSIIGTSFNGGNVYQPTPMGFAATPFAYWHGDIEYTFQIICSKFHKGKLAVFFEPNIAQAALTTAALQMNKKFVAIIDLEQTTQESFCVNWTFPKAWAAMPASQDAAQCINNITDLGNLFRCANGMIGVVPFTALQSPDGSSVGINVYARSSNMFYNEVLNSNLPTSIVGIIAESGDMDVKSDSTGTDMTCLTLNPNKSNVQSIAQLHFGELPLSFRALLKRFWTSNSASHTTAGDLPINWSGEIITPLFPNITTNLPSNMVANLLGYLRYAYVGLRGGMRKRIRLIGIDPTILGHCKIHLQTPSNATVAFNISDGAYTPTGREYLDGTTTYVPSVNGGIEFEIPFYTNNLFALSQSVDPFSGNDVPTESTALRNYTVEYDNLSGDTTLYGYEETAAAEDFCLMRFVAPPCYWG